MSNFIRKFAQDVLLPVAIVAGAASVEGCSVPPSAPAGTGETITCVGPWKTAVIGDALVYDALQNDDLTEAMGVDSSEYLGFIASAVDQANNNTQSGMLIVPTGCSIEHDQTGDKVRGARDNAQQAGNFVVYRMVEPSNAPLVLIAPTYNPAEGAPVITQDD